MFANGMTTAEQILAIPPSEPERLFSADPAARRQEFTALAKRWHPDRAGGSAAVFDKIVALRRAAEAGPAGANRRGRVQGQLKGPGACGRSHLEQIGGSRSLAVLLHFERVSADGVTGQIEVHKKLT